MWREHNVIVHGSSYTAVAAPQKSPNVKIPNVKSPNVKSTNVKSPNEKVFCWKVIKVILTLDLFQPNHTLPYHCVQSYVLDFPHLKQDHS